MNDKLITIETIVSAFNKVLKQSEDERIVMNVLINVFAKQIIRFNIPVFTAISNTQTALQEFICNEISLGRANKEDEKSKMEPLTNSTKGIPVV